MAYRSRLTCTVPAPSCHAVAMWGTLPLPGRPEVQTRGPSGALGIVWPPCALLGSWHARAVALQCWSLASCGCAPASCSVATPFIRFILGTSPFLNASAVSRLFIGV